MNSRLRIPRIVPIKDLCPLLSVEEQAWQIFASPAGLLAFSRDEGPAYHQSATTPS